MKILLFFVTITLIWSGAQSLYTNLTNSKSTTYTIEEYLEKRPDDKWLELTGCRLDLMDSAYQESRFGDDIKEVYIPVSAPKESADSENAPVQILFTTKDPEIIALLKEAGSVQSDEDAMRFALGNLDKLYPTRDISGLVRFGIDMRDKEADELRKLNSNLVEDFIMIDDGKKPEWTGAIALPIGLLLAYFVFWPKKQKAQMMPPQPSIPQAGAAGGAGGLVTGGSTPPPLDQAAEAPTIKFHCPGCQQKFSVEMHRSGEEINCPQCQSAMRIP